MRSAVCGTVAIVLALALVCAVAAQEVRTFTGRVIWVEANTMAFSPEGGGGSFDVDVSNIDQSVLMYLKSGDRVTVTGTVTADGNKLVATSVKPAS